MTQGAVRDRQLHLRQLSAVVGTIAMVLPRTASEMGENDCAGSRSVCRTCGHDAVGCRCGALALRAHPRSIRSSHETSRRANLIDKRGAHPPWHRKFRYETGNIPVGVDGTEMMHLRRLQSTASNVLCAFRFGVRRRFLPPGWNEPCLPGTLVAPELRNAEGTGHDQRRHQGALWAKRLWKH